MQTGGNRFQIYLAMMGTSNSRWLEWLNTSEVKELKLPRSVTEEKMLIMFCGKRFSELKTLNLYGCQNITDASLSKVARGCSNLQSLNLFDCSNITDASVSEVARRCSNLQSLTLNGCWNITDTSLSGVARGCSNLQALNLLNCSNITDASLLEVARRCSNLQSLDLRHCRKITDAQSVGSSKRMFKPPLTLPRMVQQLQSCCNITDASVSEVGRGCSNLHSLNLIGCRNITDACKSALQQSHPKLQNFRRAY